MIRARQFLATLLFLYACAGAHAAESQTAAESADQRVAAINYLLTDAEKCELEAITDRDVRNRWLKNFWLSKQLIHTDEKNRLRDEFNQRMSYALANFSSTMFPGWDQRGEVYIRYGEPAARGTSPREMQGPEASEGFGERRTMQTVAYAPAREIWYYTAFDMFVQFEDARDTGHYTYYTEYVNGFERARDKLYASEMDRNREGKVDDLPYTPWATRLETQVANFSEALENQPWWTPLMDNTGRVPLYCDVVVFKKPGGDELSVEIEFELDEYDDDVYPPMYVVTVVYRDQNGRIAKKTGQAVDTEGDHRLNGTLAPLRFTYITKDKINDVAVTVKETPSGEFSSITRPLPPSPSDRMVMSELLFAYEFNPATGSSVFDRGALEVIPHPQRQYDRDGKVPIYFEIYNMKVDQYGNSAYTITYEILAEDRKRKTVEVASSFKSLTRGASDRVNIVVQPENLRKGGYRCRVTVRDENSGDTIGKESGFYIAD